MTRPAQAEATPARGADDALVLDQMLSFVSHDLYGPMSMLRTYLKAVGEHVSSDAEAHQMLDDAEGMARQLEGLTGLLRDALRLVVGRAMLKPTRVDLGALAHEWSESAQVRMLASECRSGAGVLVEVDRDTLGRALEYATWQMARMGERRGDVGVRVVSGDGHVGLRLERLDGALGADVVERALAESGPEALAFLRRLPASGFPLRVARGLVSALGGKFTVEREGEEESCLLIEFAVADERMGTDER